MKIIEPSVELIDPPSYEETIKKIELAGRVCYKSEDKINNESSEKFIKGIIERGHEAVLEHSSITVKFICDRGVSHEIVRHRLAAYCQESTRYCNYSKDKFENQITVIHPYYLESDTISYNTWEKSCENSEENYFRMLKQGLTPQEARSVLPNSLKTEIFMTANVREWRHFLRLRCGSGAHPQMRQVSFILLHKLYDLYPVLFFDIYKEIYGEDDGKETSR